MTIFTYTSGVPMNQGGRNRKDSPVSAPTGQVSPRSLPHYVVTSLLCISIVREQPRESRRPSDSVSCFHKLTNCTSPNSHPSILLQMPRGGMRPPIPNMPTFKPDNVLNPVESALPQNGRVTPLESALAKKGGGGSELLTRDIRSTSLPCNVEARFSASQRASASGEVLALRFLPHRKQRRPLRRPRRDLLQLRIMLPQRLRHVHLRPFQHADQLQSVDDTLAEVVVVRNRKNLARLFRRVLDPVRPRSQLFGGIEIVVAFVRRDGWIVAEPGVIPSPMQPNVSDRRGGVLAW